MDPAQVSAISNLTAVGFADFPEATSSVLSMLEEQLPGAAVIVGQFDEATMVYRVLDCAGESSFGLERGAEMPLAETVCFRMITCTEGALLHNDPANDPLYADLPGRTGLGIGSYVGVGMRGSGGERFGAVCAIAKGSDHFAEADLQLLTVVARMLAYELERQVQMNSLEQLTRELATMTRTDDLTGLTNRIGLDIALQREWELAQRDDVGSFFVIADLDGFKQLNDRFGHLAGDEALRLFADVLRSTARSTDVLARIGGDEFGIVLVRSGPEAAAELAARVQDVLQVRLQEEPYDLDVSIGWASLGQAATPEEAFTTADHAMFETKRQRKAHGGRGGGDLTSPGGRGGRRPR